LPDLPLSVAFSSVGLPLTPAEGRLYAANLASGNKATLHGFWAPLLRARFAARELQRQREDPRGTRPDALYGFRRFNIPMPGPPRFAGFAIVDEYGRQGLGSGVLETIGDATTAAASSVARGVTTIAGKALPVIQTILRNAGPLGMAASAALSTVAAVARGESIEAIAWAAAEGAAPSGLDVAIRAAHQLREGRSPLSVALDAASSQIIPGSAPAQGLAAARSALIAGATREALAAARSRLPPAARVGFDAAVGLAARAAAGEPDPLAAARAAANNAIRDPAGAARSAASAAVRAKATATASSLFTRRPMPTVIPSRGLSRIDPLLARAGAASPRVISAAHPTVRLALGAIARDPSLGASSPAALASRLGVPVSTARAALGRGIGLRWRALSRPAVALVARHSRVPMSALTTDARAVAGDTGALDAPAKWTLKSGEFPAALAAKLTGVASKWHEFPAANAHLSMKEVHKKDSSGKVIWSGLEPWYAGLTINTPVAWQAPGAAPLPAPTVPTTIPTPFGPIAVPQIPGVTAPAAAPLPPGVPTPPIPPPAPEAAAGVTALTILQAKGTLAAWSATDGSAQAGPSAYGTSFEDMNPAWGPRDKLALASYANWHNKKGRSPTLATDGTLTQPHADALRAWAEQHAAAPAAPAPGAAPEPSPPLTIPTPLGPLTVPQIPGVTAPAAAPSAPAPTTPFPALPPPPPPIAGAPAPAKKGDDLLLGVAAAAAYFLM